MPDLRPYKYGLFKFGVTDFVKSFMYKIQYQPYLLISIRPYVEVVQVFTRGIVSTFFYPIVRNCILGQSSSLWKYNIFLSLLSHSERKQQNFVYPGCTYF